MSKILIGNKIIPKNNFTKKLIRCCSCKKEYDFEGNIFSSIEGKILICPHCGTKHEINFRPFNKKINGLIRINRLNLGAIDIGPGAIWRESTWSVRCVIDKSNPANASGKITSFQIYVDTTLYDVQVATFFVVGGNNLSTRDYDDTIGTVTPGYHEYAVDIDVNVGDYLGIYSSSGKIKMKTSGGVGTWYTNLDRIPCTNSTFSWTAGYVVSIYGTGETPIVFKDSARTGIYSFKTLKL